MRRWRFMGGNAACKTTAFMPGANFFKHGQDVGAEVGGVFAHGEVAERLHHGHLDALDALGSAQRVLGRAGEIVLAGEQVKRAGGRIDAVDLAAQITVDAIEVQVTLEHAGAAGLIHPERLVTAGSGTLRRHHTGHECRANFAAVHIGAMQPFRVVPGLLVIGRLQADKRAEAARMLGSQIKHEAATDGAPHDDGLVELQRIADVEHHLRVAGRCEFVLLGLEADGRQRFAVPGHVKGDDAIVPRDGLVVEDVAELTAVGAGRMQTDERNAAAGLFDVEAMRTARKVEVQITADDGLEAGR